jgi:hypothetical protein
MTMCIGDRIEGYTNAHLDVVIEVLELLDIEEWDADLAEYALCDAPQDVENLLTLMIINKSPYSD